jgi:hypothetical protein
MLGELSRFLRWLFDRKHASVAEQHIKKNREALEQKRQKAKQGSTVLPL